MFGDNINRSNLQKVLGDLEDSPPEKQLKIQKEKTGIETEALLAAYEICLRAKPSVHHPGNNSNSEANEFCLEQIIKSGTTEISAQLISQFAQAMVAYDGQDYFEYVTGIFLNMLIKTSYKQGNNNFKLDLRQASPINYLGDRLSGAKRRRLNVTVDGNIGYNCWDNSVYCTTKIHGNTADTFAHKAGFSSFSVAGNLGNECFDRVLGLKINIGGKTGKYLGQYADQCTITVNSPPGWRFGAGATNTKFMSRSAKTIKYIKQYAGMGCTFYILEGKKEKFVGRK
ncbi:MAG: hypothetical protein HY438_00775 [DPANN group archaeon]|nr:hypothetical protein [DPANN group archaeon]